MLIRHALRFAQLLWRGVHDWRNNFAQRIFFNAGLLCRICFFIKGPLAYIGLIARLLLLARGSLVLKSSG